MTEYFGQNFKSNPNVKKCNDRDERMIETRRTVGGRVKNFFCKGLLATRNAEGEYAAFRHAFPAKIIPITIAEMCPV